MINIKDVCELFLAAAVVFYTRTQAKITKQQRDDELFKMRYEFYKKIRSILIQIHNGFYDYKYLSNDINHKDTNYYDEELEQERHDIANLGRFLPLLLLLHHENL
jgi:hypothetical protein